MSDWLEDLEKQLNHAVIGVTLEKDFPKGWDHTPFNFGDFIQQTIDGIKWPGNIPAKSVHLRVNGWFLMEHDAHALKLLSQEVHNALHAHESLWLLRQMHFITKRTRTLKAGSFTVYVPCAELEPVSLAALVEGIDP